MMGLARDFALLSDLDGVLVDSTDSVERAWGQWARENGIDYADLEHHLHGIPSRQTIAKFAPYLDVAAESRRLDAMQADDTDGCVALPGAADLLAGVHGVPVAIVTSCDQRLAAARLGAAGLKPPDVVVTSDMVRNGKPDPEAYLLGAERLGVDPADCIVLEDAPAGVTAGKAARMRVVAVTTTHTPDRLTEADEIIADLSELAALLRDARRRAA